MNAHMGEEHGLEGTEGCPEDRVVTLDARGAEWRGGPWWTRPSGSQDAFLPYPESKGKSLDSGPSRVVKGFHFVKMALAMVCRVGDGRWKRKFVRVS